MLTKNLKTNYQITPKHNNPIKSIIFNFKLATHIITHLKDFPIFLKPYQLEITGLPTTNISTHKTKRFINYYLKNSNNFHTHITITNRLDASITFENNNNIPSYIQFLDYYTLLNHYYYSDYTYKYSA